MDLPVRGLGRRKVRGTKRKLPKTLCERTMAIVSNLQPFSSTGCERRSAYALRQHKASLLRLRSAVHEQAAYVFLGGRLLCSPPPDPTNLAKSPSPPKDIDAPSCDDDGVTIIIQQGEGQEQGKRTGGKSSWRWGDCNVRKCDETLHRSVGRDQLRSPGLLFSLLHENPARNGRRKRIVPCARGAAGSSGHS